MKVIDNNQSPLVSVTVIAYNSAKTIVETLDSIYAQTYQNLELIISDDCSTDNTVEICKEWIDGHKDRFVRVELLTSDTNKGISANCNRATSACAGEWCKGIAADDILLPDCVQDCVCFILTHPDAIYVFGKDKPFYDLNGKRHFFESFFDYSFFQKSTTEQYHHLLYEGNCIPAMTCFYNIEKVKSLNIPYDERIPYLEDFVKWLNVCKKGIKLYFLDKEIVLYRQGGISTNGIMNMNFFRSNRLAVFYYRYPEWYKEDPEMAIQKIVDSECSLYQKIIDANAKSDSLRQSANYKLGRILLSPVRIMRDLIHRF